MSFIVECDGEFVHMPLEGNWAVATLDGRFPNRVMLRMDEKRFKRSFLDRAIWSNGVGEFATLAYCGHGLTIQRHQTLANAIKAKRLIDGGGCGHDCTRVHLIIHADPANSRSAQEAANIRAYKLQHQPTP